MLKKIAKWTMIIVGCLLVIAIIFYAIVFVNTEKRINKVYAVKLQAITVPTDSVSYVAGKHVAETRGCIGCHGKNLADGQVFLDEKTPVGVLYAKNITSGKGGIQYADEDWVRLIRHGLTKDGRSAWFMPSQDVGNISNEELGQLICFLKQQPPVDKSVPAHSLKPLGRVLTFLGKFPLLPAEMIDHNMVYKDKVQAGITVEYGAYLVTTCRGCHGANMKGGPAHNPGEPPIPDISTTGHAGKWSAEGFITALHTGKTPEGKQLSDAMPWKLLTYTTDELKAIHLYLQQVK
ncbi:MAG: c-type cytochrome [Chitinophagaceae bacterium]